MIRIILGGLLVISLASCEKNNSIEPSLGLYTEISPVNGRSQLNFINRRLVVKNEPGSSFRDTFSYSFSSQKIILTPTWTTDFPPQHFEFQKIDETSFKIESLYPSIPGAPISYMTFKK